MRTSTAVSRRAYLALLAGSSLALLAAGCGGSTAPASTSAPASAPPAKKAEAQKLTMGVSTIPVQFDPHRGSPGIDLAGHGAVFDALTDVDKNGEVKPALAISWTAVNPTTWEFKLRPGVKFHTGEPLDSEVVKWNVERLVDPKFTPSILNKFPLLTGAQPVSADTVRLTTKSPDPIFLRRVSTMFLVPPAYHKQVGEDQFRSKPSGTGPWRVRTFQKDERVVLERVEGSWRGIPKLSEVTMVAMPDSSSRLAALRTGEIDVAGFLATDQAEAVRQAGLVVKSIIIQKIHIIALDTIKDSPVKDKRVRQALNYAVDVGSLVKNIMQGFGRALDGQVVGPDAFGYNPKLKAYPFDPAKAKQLLAEAGFPNGFPIGFNSPSGGYVNDKETAEALVGYFGNVGIQAKLEFNEYAEHIRRRQQGTLHPIYLHGYNYFPGADADFTLSWWDSARVGPRFPTYNNPNYDKILRASQIETDPQKRLQMVLQASEILYEDPPVIFLFQPADVYGLQKNVQNFEPSPDTRIGLDSVDKSS